MRNAALILLIIVLPILSFTGCKKTDGGNKTASSSHNSTASKKMGGACQSCHTSGGSGPGWWTVAGTIFTTPDGVASPNGTVSLYSEPGGTGTLLGTLEADAYGNFYSSTLVLPSSGWYPQITSAAGVIQNMPQLCLSGNCNSCHGVTTSKIYEAAAITSVN